VEKHRNGGTGIADVNCFIEYQNFSDREKKYSEKDIPPSYDTKRFVSADRQGSQQDATDVEF